MKPRCHHCGARYTWSRQSIIEAVQAWAARHGAPPTMPQWKRAAPEHPEKSTVQRVFGSWNEMIEAAGFGPRRPGGQREYTREQAQHALFEWVYEHGRVPRSADWREWNGKRPTATQMVTLFGSWSAAVVACGYEPRGRGSRGRTTDGYRRVAGAAARRLAA